MQVLLRVRDGFGQWRESSYFLFGKPSLIIHPCGESSDEWQVHGLPSAYGSYTIVDTGSRDRLIEALDS